MDLKVYQSVAERRRVKLLYTSDPSGLYREGIISAYGVKNGIEYIRFFQESGYSKSIGKQNKWKLMSVAKVSVELLNKFVTTPPQYANRQDSFFDFEYVRL